MDGETASEGSDGFDWESEDERESNLPFSSCLPPTVAGQEEFAALGKASSSAGPPESSLFQHFVRMGFSEKLVGKALEENGEGNAEAILELLLTFSVLENSPRESEHVHSNPSSENEGDLIDELSDVDDDLQNEESMDPLSDKEKKLLLLVDMGYPIDVASTAIDRCGPGSSIMELTDFITAAEMAKAVDDAYVDEVPAEDLVQSEDLFRVSSFKFSQVGPSHFHKSPKGKRREYFEDERWERKRHKACEKKIMDEDDEDTIRLPNPMIGFGVPGEPLAMSHRTLPEAAIGPPYFYYENVALAPKGVWQTISRFLYDIEPEFVDSKHFCAAARKRGYVHNLPIHNRYPLLPIPPLTIHEALPLTKKWWPSWDWRTKLNCLQTVTASARLTERIRKALDGWDGEPPLKVQKYVLDECRRWNLVWVGRNKVAPLEPDEMEMLLGFPKNHTRGGGISRTERIKALGNSFQVDTVAYHLSVLKNMFPNGISVLSLFSGIGGAEVALHRLGVHLKNVVSVEISETNRNIFRSWWEQTNQTGNLIDIADVQQLNGDRLEKLISSFGGFDLIVGGSPCNNLAGGNRVSRDGLEGKHSALFYDYFRILDLVKCIMGRD
ncbi:PREDICTED: DNA (cytosine-5)-methyltransferase DRM2-like isoform X1 [Nelumbo nucifera]|uniref:DNA (cytosine-5-)-methyltransferase n=1 Tax=Nelumbo nucifera TaxID=4432 RepID=A0A1U7ZCB9_NELNU|nr:PREDICTED: DNA (cytosine-5)-methyltransferase DRM2-like isoform X1 [Nelumbo nucifera]XP_010251208.1 PREDICTED: DNA (cytosine-5)-methyltransferase DRM2-like isoform X1 [Nelumbo nucifera]XP_010251209.1 PREDICTED: DNA (cytosine-5)-methyltransferase DRM2-like isoform X1 [Nelumbo nucifera]XP_010251211.1 PREDICTED: DNA (cytosine-5)-methyltransferase DRM2-like isoform X1 [Nelumbo nucifera]XP_010251212.1 PREDICTED: DNA (cytosine-5)-methyltransferase DRM2-like isoform X1 [Nelumbo nucifera]